MLGLGGITSGFGNKRIIPPKRPTWSWDFSHIYPIDLRWSNGWGTCREIDHVFPTFVGWGRTRRSRPIHCSFVGSWSGRPSKILQLLAGSPWVDHVRRRLRTRHVDAPRSTHWCHSYREGEFRRERRICFPETFLSIVTDPLRILPCCLSVYFCFHTLGSILPLVGENIINII